MRFATIEPDTEHSIIRHVLFVCDCGRVSDQMIIDGAPNK
jgi:hypothetical protein